MMSFNQYRVQQLRMTNQEKVLEGILALLTAIFITALLPSLLLQYLYADQMLTEAPPLLNYLPVVTFGAGVLYLLYVIIGNVTRSQEITRLEREMMMSADSSTMDTSSNDAELEELEALVDEALATHSSKTTSKKGTSKRKGQKR
jgi:hypothetical protein